MFRKSVFGVLAVTAAAAAAVAAVRYVKNRRNSADETGAEESDEVRFIEINDEEDSEDDSDEPGPRPGETHVNSVSLDDAEGAEDALDVQNFLPGGEAEKNEETDADVLEIAGMYPYLTASFIAETLDRNEEFSRNYPEDTLVSIMHTCAFEQTKQLLDCELILADAGYICQHSEDGELRAAKRFFSEEGAVISDILNVANQAAALGGRYLGCELN